MKRKSKLILASISLVGTVILIVMLRLVDVAPIGANNTSIGLAHINRFFFNLFGVNMIWYAITDWLGIVAILTAFLFFLVGFTQLVKRKKIIKVDREILALGVLYIIVIGLYVVFERLVVNYRPIIMPGSINPEASFPSSHTMLVCVIMGSAIMMIGRYIKHKPLCVLLKTICAIIIGVTIIGRLISGVHWFTDIIGGILISISLLLLFSTIGLGDTNKGKMRKL